LNLLRTDTAGESWVLLGVYSSRDIRWELGLLKRHGNIATRPDFGFEFAEILVIVIRGDIGNRKTTPGSLSRGVADSPI
jgi:hypothetical protein